MEGQFIMLDIDADVVEVSEVRNNIIYFILNSWYDICTHEWMCRHVI